LLELLEDRVHSVKTLGAKARSTITNTSGKVSSKQIIILRKPSDLRLDALTPFGNPSLSITTDGENISIYNYAKNTFFSGGTDDLEISRLFPASIGFENLMIILTGAVPIIEYDKARVRVDIKDDLYRLTLAGGNMREEVYFDSIMLDTTRAVVFGPDEEVRLLVALNDYEDIDGVRMPSSISASLPGEHYSMEIRYSEINLNNEIENDIFILLPVN